MKVYHGSYTEIEEIDLSKSLPNKDFGRGFYVTKFRHHAESWAKIIGRRHKTDGFVTEFEYHETAFAKSICKIKHFAGYDEEWLNFVIMNRNKNNPEPTHDYDIVEGPVADDKVQNRIDYYLQGRISKVDFLEDVKFHEQTHQICFCTGRSLQVLDYAKDSKRIKYELSIIAEPVLERLILDNNISEEKATDIFFSSQLFIRLSDKSTKYYEKSWQEIYELLRQEIKR